jgi:hypothetical protein
MLNRVLGLIAVAAALATAVGAAFALAAPITGAVFQPWG